MNTECILLSLCFHRTCYGQCKIIGLGKQLSASLISICSAACILSSASMTCELSIVTLIPMPCDRYKKVRESVKADEAPAELSGGPPACPAGACHLILYPATSLKHCCLPSIMSHIDTQLWKWPHV